VIKKEFFKPFDYCFSHLLIDGKYIRVSILQTDVGNVRCIISNDDDFELSFTGSKTDAEHKFALLLEPNILTLEYVTEVVKLTQYG
jgi:hypothetical protein